MKVSTRCAALRERREVLARIDKLEQSIRMLTTKAAILRTYRDRVETFLATK